MNISEERLHKMMIEMQVANPAMDCVVMEHHMRVKIHNAKIGEEVSYSLPGRFKKIVY